MSTLTREFTVWVIYSRNRWVFLHLSTKNQLITPPRLDFNKDKLRRISIHASESTKKDIYPCYNTACSMQDAICNFYSNALRYRNIELHGDYFRTLLICIYTSTDL